MAADGNLLKGEVKESPAEMRDKDVEALLLSFMRALIAEQGPKSTAEARE